MLEVEKSINYIGEGVIKDKLKAALCEKHKKEKNVLDETDKDIIQKTVLQLKNQKKHLEQMIYNLEETINDKN